MGEGLSRLVGLLEEGYEPQDSEFGAFSDLGRADVAVVRERWPQIPVATRAVLIERAAELADEHLDYNFEALARIGLDDPEVEVRERAVTTLWESEDRDIAERLAELAVNDPGPGVRASAALALQNFVEAYVMDRVHSETGEKVTAALKRAVEDPDIGVRASALEAAGPLPDEWVATRILEAYESDEHDLKISAIRAMGSSALERWIEYIEDQLNDGDLEFRLEATLAAGALGSPLLIEPMGELLSDDNPEIVVAAIVALGEIGGEEAVELLENFKPHAPEGLDEAIDGAIELASGGGFRRFGEIPELGAVGFDEEGDDYE